MNLQVFSTPDGDIVWVSGPLPGATHDLSAARIWGILRELAAAGLIVLADTGYHGAGQPLLTPYKAAGSRNRRKTPTALTPGCAEWGNAPTPSSRHGASCGNYAAAPGVPAISPKPSTFFRPARPKDENGSLKAAAVTRTRSSQPR